MESPNHGVAPVQQGSGSRPTIAFPLGTALLLLVIFGLSGIFSFCYHWEKRRNIISRRTGRVEAGALDVGHCRPQAPHLVLQFHLYVSLLILLSFVVQLNIAQILTILVVYIAGLEFYTMYEFEIQL